MAVHNSSLAKGISKETQLGPILGGIAGAHYVDAAAKAYGVPVILNTDHCAKKLLPWVDGLLAASEEQFAKTGKPLYSSHMLDLSEEPLEENVETCAKYLARMSKLGMTLEIELGVTGGEEDGVDNTGVDESRLYTQPEEVAKAYSTLNAISPNFTVAAAFGNVHGVYKPGNVQAEADHLERLAGPHREEIRNGTQAGEFCFPWGLGLVARGNPGGYQLRRHQDESGYRPPVGFLGRHPRLRGQESRLFAGADRQSGGT